MSFVQLSTRCNHQLNCFLCFVAAQMVAKSPSQSIFSFFHGRFFVFDCSKSCFTIINENFSGEDAQDTMRPIYPP